MCPEADTGGQFSEKSIQEEKINFLHTKQSCCLYISHQLWRDGIVLRLYFFL